MGRMKELWGEIQALSSLGLENPPYGQFVCVECCFDGDDVRALVKENEIDEPCSYCNKQGAAPLVDIFAMVVERIRTEWCPISDSGLSLETIKEGNWPGAVDRCEVPGYVGLEAQNDQIVEDLGGALTSGDWVENEPYGVSEFQGLKYGWERFCKRVKHHRRYFFSDEDSGDEYPDPNEIPPSSALSVVVHLAMNSDLCHTLPAGTTVYRARVGKHTAEGDMLSPPPEHTVSSRMSPIGIPMFYGSFDLETALNETYIQSRGECGDIVTVATFKTAVPISVVDLSRLPPIPSLLSAEWRKRDGIIFIRHFATDVAEPVEKDGREHVNYVPTQVFAEYLMTSKSRDGDFPTINGIVYASARHSGGKSFAVSPNTATKYENGQKERHDRNLIPGPTLQWYKRDDDNKWVITPNE